MTEVISTVSETALEHRTYQLDDCTYRTVHSSFALATFSSRRNTSDDPSVLLIHPADQDPDKELFRVEAERAGIDHVEFISASRSDQARNDLLERLLSRDPSEETWFDVTDAGGDHAVLLTCIGAYMQARDRAPCLYNGVPGTSSDLIRFTDRSRLLRLPSWGSAIRTLRTHFESGPVSDQLDRLHDESYKRDLDHTSQQLQRLSTVLTRSIRSACSALPLEAGRAGSSVGGNETFREQVETDLRALAPGTDYSVEELLDTVRSVSLDGFVQEKEEIPLTENELKRQFHLVERLTDSGNVLPAFVLARELLVNGAILGRSERVPGEEWLDPDVRERHIAPFYHVTHWNRDEKLRGLMDEDQRRLARVWDSVKRRRNDLAHAGISRENVRLERLEGRLEQLFPEIRELVLENRSTIDDLTSFSFEGRALLHPYGASEDVSTLDRVSDGLQEGDTVYLLVPSGTEDPEETEVVEALKDRGLNAEIWRFPSGEKAYEHWASIWSYHRGTLLQNERIDTVVHGGTPAVRYACRKIYEEIRHYGIHARQIGCPPREDEEKEERKESDPKIILEECWQPLRARSQ